MLRLEAKHESVYMSEPQRDGSPAAFHLQTKTSKAEFSSLQVGCFEVKPKPFHKR